MIAGWIDRALPGLVDAAIPDTRALSPRQRAEIVRQCTDQLRLDLMRAPGGAWWAFHLAVAACLLFILTREQRPAKALDRGAMRAVVHVFDGAFPDLAAKIDLFIGPLIRRHYVDRVEALLRPPIDMRVPLPRYDGVLAQLNGKLDRPKLDRPVSRVRRAA